MPKRGRAADKLHDEASDLRGRAAFYEMEARYGPPPPVEEAEERAARLNRLADQLDREASDALKPEPASED